MATIALLHPQCVRLGGAIQMALQSAHALQNLWHEVIVYTFERDDQCFPGLQEWLTIKVWNKASKNPLKKLINITTLAWHLRHVDTIVANNPPMQIVALLAKAFSGSRVRTIWWHHHVPWYYNKKWLIIALKGWLEKHYIIPSIDDIVATSQYVSDCIGDYCGRDSTVIHPILYGQKDRAISHTTTTTSNKITFFTHGRLEPEKGVDMVVRIYERLQKEHTDIHLIVFWQGSLTKELQEKNIDVRPFDRNTTFETLHSDTNWHVIGVYCSSIDAFGIAPLETQAADFLTVVLDRGGARESILSNVSGDPVGYLVQDEEALFRILSHYVKEKSFPKPVSNVNFSHTQDYFTTERLTRDLSILIAKARP